MYIFRDGHQLIPLLDHVNNRHDRVTGMNEKGFAFNLYDECGQSKRCPDYSL